MTGGVREGFLLSKKKIIKKIRPLTTEQKCVARDARRSTGGFAPESNDCPVTKGKNTKSWPPEEYKRTSWLFEGSPEWRKKVTPRRASVVPMGTGLKGGQGLVKKRNSNKFQEEGEKEGNIDYPF